MNLFRNAMFLLVIAATLVLPVRAQSSAAEDPQGARDFIQTLADTALAAWTDTQLTEEERKSRFYELLFEGFYVQYIGRFALGRYRQEASEQQINRFDDVFPQFVVQTFQERIGDYADERIEVTDHAPAGRRDIIVRSKILRPSDTDLLADWRVRRIGDDFKIIDVKLEGISMATTLRSDFQEKISKQGFDGLVEELASKIGRAPGGESE